MSGFATDTAIASLAAEIGQAMAGRAKRDMSDVTDAVFGGKAFTATGASAARSLKDRFVDVLNLKDFGAVGDNSHDDTAAVQAAFDAAGGRPIFAPAGQYKLTSSITSSVPVHLFGVGNGSGPGPSAQANAHVTQFLAYFGNADVFQVNGIYPPIFRDFQINLDPSARPATAGAGIAIRATGTNIVTNTKIENVAFTNLYRPIYFFRPAWSTVRGCSFQGWIDYAIYCETSAGIEAGAGWIDSNYFFAFSTSEGCIYLSCGYGIISRNEILGGNYGVRGSIANNDAGFIHVIDNTIENQVQTGVLLESADGHTLAHVTIADNEFSVFSGMSSTFRHIRCGNDATSTIEMLKITGNQFQSALTLANHRYISVLSGTNILVADNQVHALGGSSVGYGIALAGVSSNAGLVGPIVVKDNLFSGDSINRYALGNDQIAFHSDQPMTVAELSTLNTPANGSTVYVSDGKVTGPTDPTLSASGSGCVATRQRGAWYAPYGMTG